MSYRVETRLSGVPVVHARISDVIEGYALGAAFAKQRDLWEAGFYFVPVHLGARWDTVGVSQHDRFEGC